MSKKYPKSVTDPDFDTTAYGKDLTKTLMVEMFKILEEERKQHGSEFGNRIMMNFLASYMTTIVFNVLKKGAMSSSDPNEQYRVTHAAFAETKQNIEECVGQAFSNAFNLFDPSRMPDYQCTVQLLDDGDLTRPMQ